MTEELLYLSMLVSRVNSNYELSLARSLVADKYPINDVLPQYTLQEIQESFEELATCIRNNLPLPLPSQNPFSIFATQFKIEQ